MYHVQIWKSGTKELTKVHLGIFTTAAKCRKNEERREIEKVSARGKALRLLVKLYFTINEIWKTITP